MQQIVTFVKKESYFFKKVKIMGKLEITAITLANIDRKHIVFAILNFIFHTKAQAMIIILS